MALPSKQQGLIVTITVHVLVILILLFLQMAAMLPMKPAGSTVNFGYIDDGSGDNEPEAMQSPKEETSSVIPPPVSKPAPAVKKITAKPAAKILTGENKDAPVVRKQTQEEIDSLQRVVEEKKMKKQADLERQRIETEQKRQADLENQRIEAERKKQEQQQSQVNAIKGRMGKSFGGTSTRSGSQGEGNSKGAGNQGDPTGSVDSKNRGPGGGTGPGISYSLDGRSLMGSLAKPEYAVNDYGTVIVTITVSKDGDVIAAVPGAKGTTTTNSILWEAARKAAILTKFNRVTGVDAPIQKGTIKYNFKLL
jgi:TolA-binding protein